MFNREANIRSNAAPALAGKAGVRRWLERAAWGAALIVVGCGPAESDVPSSSSGPQEQSSRVGEDVAKSAELAPASGADLSQPRTDVWESQIGPIAVEIPLRSSTWCADWTQTGTPPFVDSHPTPPDGTEANPYRICDVTQLQYIADDPGLFYNDWIELHADIDASTLDKPIGSTAQFFRAKFDGRGHTISNFSHTSTESRVGLFGYVNGLVLSNLHLVNIDVTGASDVGVIAGRADGGSITNVTVDDQSSAHVTTGDHAGGAVGMCRYSSGQITNTTTAATVTSDGTGQVGGFVGDTGCFHANSSASGSVTAAAGASVGGFVGFNDGATTFSNCSATGDVVGGGQGVGGFIGRYPRRTAIENSFATGTVSNTQIATGGFIGTSSGNDGTGVIRNCYATGNVTSTKSRSGGFVGYIHTNSTLRTDRCFATGDVYGDYNAGGFVGLDLGFSVHTRGYYRDGDVAGRFNVGGFAGSIAIVATVSEAYAAPNSVVATDGDVGAFIGDTQAGGSVDLDRVYFRSDLELSPGVPLPGFGVPRDTSAGELFELTGLTNAELMQPDSFALWDMSYAWIIATPGADYPALTGSSSYCDDYDQSSFPTIPGHPSEPDGSAGNPYRICDAAQLQHIADNLASFQGSYVDLYHDIEVSSLDKPLGSGATPFDVHFNGRGHVLRNFVHTSAGDYVGFFGNATGSIQNLTLMDVEVSGASHTGAVAGRFDSGTMTQVHVVPGSTVTGTAGNAHGGALGGCYGSVAVDRVSSAATVAGVGRVGGLVGTSECTVQNSFATGPVTSSGESAGGLIGYQNGTQQTRDSWSSGAVSGGGDNTGGFIGRYSTVSTIESCFTLSEVSSTGAATGGFLGLATGATGGGAVRACSAEGSVSGAANTGGFLGASDTAAVLEHAFATGNVSGTTNVGGFVGVDDGASSYSRVYSHSGSVTASGAAAGGFAGAIASASVSEVYAAPASVTAASDGGAFLGAFIGSSADFDRLYHRSDLSLPSIGSAGSLPQSEQNELVGANDADLKLVPTYGRWNMLVDWQIVEPATDYPSLRPFDTYCSDYVQLNTPPFVAGLPAPEEPDGSANKPYRICDVAQLEHVLATPTLLDGDHFDLRRDIDLSTLSAPIGSQATPFQGSFDGRGFTLSGFSHTTTNDGVGLFGETLNATIADLRLTGFQVEGGSRVGIVAGRVSGGSISDVSIDATSTATGVSGSAHGGALGECVGSDTLLRRVHSDAVVTGVQKVGGLLGSSECQTFDSVSTGSVSGSSDSVGSFVGATAGGVSFLRSYATGDVSGLDHVGGFVGRDVSVGGYYQRAFFHTGTVSATNHTVGGFAGTLSGTARVSEAYAAPATVTGVTEIGAFQGVYAGNTDFDRSYYRADLGVPPLGLDGGIAPHNATQLIGASDNALKQDTTFEGWDFISVWSLDPGVTYPALQPPSTFCGDYEQLPMPPFVTGFAEEPDGSQAKPYRICNVTQLQHLADDPAFYYNKYVELHADIDASTLTKPIGTAAQMIRVRFDGRGHTVANFSYSSTAESKVGLFGHTNGSHISNLNLSNIDVEGVSAVGAIVGEMRGGSINDVHVDALSSVTGGTGTAHGGAVGQCLYSSGLIDRSSTAAVVISNGSGRVGGFAGRSDCNISNSRASGNVSATSGDNVAGFMAFTDGSATYSNCAAFGDVSGAGSNIGGFLGRLASRMTVENCFAVGDVSNTGNLSTGGFAGGATGNDGAGSVTGCFATGNVSSSSGRVGGFIGYIHTGSTLKFRDSYATGDVTAANRAGGFVGYDRSAATVYQRAYAHGGAIVSTSYEAGGFAGFMGASSTLTEVYAAPASVSGTSEVGVVFGDQGGNGLSLDRLYYRNDLGLPPIGYLRDLPQAMQDEVRPASDADMKLAATYSLWNFSSVWEVVEAGVTYPSRRGECVATAANDTTCDGLDDDCDGEIDEDYVPAPTSCGVGACAATGTSECFFGVVRDSCTEGTPAANDATCDGVDDDCDGADDEDYVVSATSCGAGACAATGQNECQSGSVVDTCSAGTPAANDATCDGVDDDCDGANDEDFVVATTSCGVGACAASGQNECQSGSVVDTCSAGTPAANDATCDGIDDDCDGEVDEDYAPVASNCGVGACAATGTTSCVGGSVEDSCTAGTPAANDATCDGVDDDCDGSADEDFASTATSCGVGACAATGTTSCVGGAVQDSCTAGTPAAEDSTCDGVDDDCDGSTDEDYASTSTNCGVGACAATGSTSCVGGAVEDSCTAGTPAANDATCDGVDDDCDGSTDEDFAGTATSCGVGACAATGTTSCVSGSVEDSCTAGTPAADDATCNGVDDDCDGTNDEDYTPTATNCGVGACAATGQLQCQSGSEVDTCSAGTAGTDDTCDGVDDDCDGSVDEHYVPGPTSCGVGACSSTGTRTCVGGQEQDSCTPGTPAGSDTTCDNVDDDCNGTADDGFVPVPTTCGIGACQASGQQTCVGGTLQDDCSPGSPSGDDSTCDGVDDDCDGSADEGYTPSCSGDSRLTCESGSEVSTPCSDDDVCNGEETCSGSSCVAGTPLDTDDGNDCTANNCDPVQGVQNPPLSSGTPCGAGGSCDGSGTCVAGGPPSIDTEPQSVSVDAGQTFTLTVVATGASSYQWRRFGVDIAGATAATYQKPAVFSDNGAVYTVVVTNANGSVTSAEATVTVNDNTPPVLTVNGPTTLTTQAQFVTITGSAVDGGTGLASVTASNDRYAGQSFGAVVDVLGAFTVEVPVAVGANAVTITATDNSANASNAPVSVTVELANLPQIDITSPADGAVVSTDTIDVTGSVRSALQPDAIQLTLGGDVIFPTGSGGEYTFTFEDVRLSAGSNVLTVQSLTAYGSTTDQVVVTLQTDTAPGDGDPPVISLSAGQSEIYVEGDDVPLSGTVTAPSSACISSITVNGSDASITGSGSSVTFDADPAPAFPQGVDELTITVQAVDCDSRSSSVVLTAHRDATAPVLVVNALQAAPAINPIDATPYQLTGTVTEKNLSGLSVNNTSIAVLPGSGQDEWDFDVNIGLIRGQDTTITVEAWDYAGNRVPQDFVLNLSTSLDLEVLSPAAGANFVVDGTGLDLQVLARAAGMAPTDTIVASVDGGGEVTLTRSGDTASGNLAVPGATGQRVITVQVKNSGGTALATVLRTITVEDDASKPLEVVRQEPANGATNLEPNTNLQLYFNKPIDPAKLEIELLQSVIGRDYPSRPAGEDITTLSRVFLVDVHKEREAVAGTVAHFPSNTMAAFYPSSRLHYDSVITATVSYDGQELSRSTFQIRTLPTLINTWVSDAYMNQVSGIEVELADQGVTQTTDITGGARFGFGTVERAVVGGSQRFLVNPNNQDPRYSSQEVLLNVREGLLNEFGPLRIYQLDRNEPYRPIASGDASVSLRRGDLELDLSGAELAFGDGYDEGLVHTQLLVTSQIGVNTAPFGVPQFAYSIQPQGVGVTGGVDLSMAFPAMGGGTEYVQHMPERVLIYGRDEASLLLVPVGVGLVDRAVRRVVTERALELSRLDYIACVPLPDNQTLLEEYATGDMPLRELVAKLAGLTTGEP